MFWLPKYAILIRLNYFYSAVQGNETIFIQYTVFMHHFLNVDKFFCVNTPLERFMYLTPWPKFFIKFLTSCNLNPLYFITEMLIYQKQLNLPIACVYGMPQGTRSTIKNPMHWSKLQRSIPSAFQKCPFYGPYQDSRLKPIYSILLMFFCGS